MKSTPFSRIAAIMIMAQGLMSNGISQGAALIQAGADKYRSRGKGRARTPAKRVNRGGTGKHYGTHSQAREIARHQRQGLRNVMVNGFELIQRS